MRGEGWAWFSSCEQPGLKATGLNIAVESRNTSFQVSNNERSTEYHVLEKARPTWHVPRGEGQEGHCPPLRAQRHPAQERPGGCGCRPWGGLPSSAP